MMKLIDNFGRRHTYLRISVTDRCNLKCFYCMPHEGIKWLEKDKLLDFDEIERVARIFVKMGIEKIRLTGGEPLVRKDLIVLIKKLGKIPGLNCLAMTTNAMLLKDSALELKNAGVTHINISIDSMKKERFTRITGRDGLDQVMAGIEAALKADFPVIKLNVVAISGVNEDEILDFVAFVKDKAINLRFIEFMPFKNNDWKIDSVITYAQMLDLIRTQYKLNQIEGDLSNVAKDYAIQGATGTVSFVSSMSESFCASCNRIRMTSDGSIKSCLFYPAETNIRDAIRGGASDHDIETMILYSLNQKPEAHPPAEELAKADNRAMIEIGG